MFHHSRKRQSNGTSISSSYSSNLQSKLGATVQDVIHMSHGFLVLPPQCKQGLSRQTSEPVSCHHPQQEQCNFCSCFLTILLHVCYFQGLQYNLWSVSYFQGFPLLPGWTTFISPIRCRKKESHLDFSHKLSTLTFPSG